MDVETWKFINTFAPWLSAIGTLSAVTVSLYLARAEKPMKLEVRAGHRIIIEQGQKGKPPGYLYISAINTGHRIATITNVGWRVGLFRKRHVIQLVQKDIYSSGVPVRIDDGEEAKWRSGSFLWIRKIIGLSGSLGISCYLTLTGTYSV